MHDGVKMVVGLNLLLATIRGYLLMLVLEQQGVIKEIVVCISCVAYRPQSNKRFELTK